MPLFGAAPRPGLGRPSATDTRAMSAYALLLRLLLLLGLFIKGVQEWEPLNPMEILDIACYQRQRMHQRGHCHERIAEGHLSLLSHGYSLIEYRLREGQRLRQTKELF